MLQIHFGQCSLRGPKTKYCKAYVQGLMALSGGLGALLELSAKLTISRQIFYFPFY